MSLNLPENLVLLSCGWIKTCTIICHFCLISTPIQYFCSVYVIPKILQILIQNKTFSRIFINTFFRTAAIVPPNQKVVVILEKSIHSTCPRKSKMDTIYKVIDYTAIVVKACIAHMLSSLLLSDLDRSTYSTYRDVSLYAPQALSISISRHSHLFCYRGKGF